MRNAWEMGMDASGFPRMTPAEVRGAFVCFTERMRRKKADMDTLAFLIGSYTAVGVNAPRKYPREPKNAKKIMEKGRAMNRPEMTDEEMKNVMLAFAAQVNGSMGK